MENYQTLKVEIKDQVALLFLARPEVHNALNGNMILEITDCFKQLENRKEIRIVVLRGIGKSFCSGADLGWMKNAFALSEQENIKESVDLSTMFKSIYKSSKIVISAIHGNTYGGGIGIVAACDLSYCLANSKFSLSETRLGMAAATITPYLLHKIHVSDLKELIFTARSFSGEEAQILRLVNQAFTTIENMDFKINSIIEQILSNGKLALVESKRLINLLTQKFMDSEMEQIPNLFSRIRVSEEAREGFSAFLEKRKPNW